MLRNLTFTFCALFLTSVTLGLTGCSEDRSNLLPPETATEINTGIDEVTGLYGIGECYEAYGALGKLKTLVSGLNTDVDEKIRDNLTSGVNQLNQKVHTTCKQTDTSTTPPDKTSQSDVTPDGTTGTTGTTATTGTTSDTSTDEKPGKGNGKALGVTKDKPTKPEKKPKPTPTEPTKPEPTTPDTTPDPATPPDNPDTGGISPG